MDGERRRKDGELERNVRIYLSDHFDRLDRFGGGRRCFRLPKPEEVELWLACWNHVCSATLVGVGLCFVFIQ